MTEKMVKVRYMVEGVDQAIEFYTRHFSSELARMLPAAFAEVARANLRLLLATIEELGEPADGQWAPNLASSANPRPVPDRLWGPNLLVGHLLSAEAYRLPKAD